MTTDFTMTVVVTRLVKAALILPDTSAFNYTLRENLFKVNLGPTCGCVYDLYLQKF